MVEQPNPAAENFKYDAFLSYRRSDGTAAARWLRSRLLSYSLPKPLLKGERRKLRVYLDTVYERATEDFFSQNIEPSLRQSRFLIVVSTPGALAPRPDGSPNWVHREVETFSQLPQGHNVVVALAEGEMSHPLPGDLAEKFPRIEIVDIRELSPARFIWWPKLWRLREEFLKIVAPLHDVPVESMPALRLEESRRRQRSLWLTLVSSVVLVALMTGLFVWAFLNLTRARQQLIRTHLLQGQNLFTASPAEARLHFAEAVRIADASLAVSLASGAERMGLIDLGLRGDYAKARLWLGQWRSEVKPQVVWGGLGIKSVEFSPGGRRFATVSADGYAQVWDAVTGQPVGKRVNDSPYAFQIKFSPDGRRFIVLSATTFLLQLWDAETGEPVGAQMLHDGPVASASFHPDGRTLATAGGLGHVYFWDAETGERRGDPLDVADAWLVAFSPDGNLFAAITHGNAAQIWDYATRRPIGKAIKYERSATNYGLIASFSPDSRRLLIATGDNSVQGHDMLVGESAGAKLAHSDAITSASFSPDGKRILTSSRDGTAQVWDAGIGLPPSKLLRHNGPVLDAAFSPDGRLVVTASDAFTAVVWDAATGAPVGHPLQHADIVYSARFSPDGSRVATASEDGTARLWSINSAGRPVSFGDRIKSASLSHDGTRLLTVGEDKTLKVWNWPGPTPAGREAGKITDVEEAVFSPDGKNIWLRTSRQEIYVWSYETGEMRPMLGGAGEQKEARFSYDMRRAVTQDRENVVRIWDAATGKQVGRAVALEESDGFDVTPNGDFLFALHDDNSVEVFGVVTGTAAGRPIRPPGEVQSVLCAPDGKRVWVVVKDEKKNYSLLVFDVASAEVVAQRRLATGLTLSEFSADGRAVLSTAEDYTAQVWNAAAVEPVGRGMRHSYVVNDAKFSPDGKLVLTVRGGVGQVWDAATGEPIGSPLSLGENADSSAFGADGRRVFLAGQHQIIEREYAADDAPAESLRRAAELATVLTLDTDTGSIRMLNREEWLLRK